MLRKIYIRNYTLIDEMEIPFYPGFSVITGETGAGKSIIIGAIGLLLGNRADARLVKKGKDKCIIEATFDLSIYHSDVLRDFFVDNNLDYDPEECLLRREINVNGKSRAFINDTPVNLSILRDLGEQLIDVHSQHQNLLLNKEDFQLRVIDIIARDKDYLNDYQKGYRRYLDELKKLANLRDEIRKNRENEDFMRFQLNELDEANLVEGEQETLEQTSEIMRHTEDIKRVLHEADNCLDGEDGGIVNRVRNLSLQLHNIRDIYPKAVEVSERLDNCFIELKDVSQEISQEMDDVEFDPARFNEITARLDTIYSLQQKYHVNTITELITKRTELETLLKNIDNSEETLRECEDNVVRLKTVCEEKASGLTNLRAKASKEVEADLSRLLIPLGIPNVRFEVKVNKTELGINGTDKVVFLFSANSSTEMLPIAQVASGGEIARVMLSLKAMISKAIGLPTIIFDEIDTGVSGRVAEQMAHIMKDMGQVHRQVICITHLPQIAAYGTTHYKVSKMETSCGTVSEMRQLTDEQRVTEIAQMLSGSNVTKAAIDNAKSLLKN